MGTDFIDDDLLTPSVSTPRGVAVEGEPGAARQKEQLAEQVASATEEIERLRFRQEALEQEKQKLQHLAQTRAVYESDKDGVLENFSTSLVLMEKQEEQAARMMELLSASRARFRELQQEIHDINEAAWDDADFGEDLYRSVALVDNARSEYAKALAKLDAEGLPRSRDRGDAAARDASGLAARGFIFWLKVGFAMSLPLILILLALFGGYLYSQGAFG